MQTGIDHPLQTSLNPKSKFSYVEKDVGAKQRHTTRLLYLLTIITVLTSSSYLVFYIVINAMLPTMINVAVIILYLTTIVLVRINKVALAKNWIFYVFMAHLFVLTTVVFTKETGFHFYYFAVPPSVLLVFDYHEKKQKLSLCLVAFFLFCLCEMIANKTPYIHLSALTNRILYLSAILAIFAGLSIVILIFARDIKKNEIEQSRLIQALQKNLQEIKTLKGFLPICSVCKKIRDDKGYWNQLEAYIQAHSEAEFSHSICKDCAKKLYPDLDHEK